MTRLSHEAPENDVDPVRIWIRFLRLHQRLSGVASTWLKGIGLSIAQLDALTVLDQNRGITQQMLAGRLYVTKGNVSGLIDRLVEAGFVERRAIPGDRRSHSLFITPAGEEKVAMALAAQDDFVRATLGRMAEGDVATLGRLLAEWRDIARTEQQGGPPPAGR
jgi:DNA-binding MarR family transcriptional regulator